MSKTQRVIDLVKEISELEARVESKLSELKALVGDGAKKPGKTPVKSSAEADGDWPSAIVRYLSSNRGRACKADEICKAIECPVHILVYHMRPLIDEKKVKRVKRGYYQLRGRG